MIALFLLFLKKDSDFIVEYLRAGEGPLFKILKRIYTKLLESISTSDD